MSQREEQARRMEDLRAEIPELAPPVLDSTLNKLFPHVTRSALFSSTSSNVTGQDYPTGPVNLESATPTSAPGVGPSVSPRPGLGLPGPAPTPDPAPAPGIGHGSVSLGLSSALSALPGTDAAPATYGSGLAPSPPVSELVTPGVATPRAASRPSDLAGGPGPATSGELANPGPANNSSSAPQVEKPKRTRKPAGVQPKKQKLAPEAAPLAPKGTLPEEESIGDGDVVVLPGPDGSPLKRLAPDLGLFTRRLRAMHPLSFLDQKDLENVLLPNSCLSQFHINAALHVMGQTYKDVRFLDSFWDVYAGLDLRGKKAALWIHYDSDRKHWRLVVFPPDSVDVFILDSLTYSQDDQDAIKVHYAYASDLPEPYWDIHWIETPKQTDGFSCGLFCLWWAISLAASSSPIPDDRCRDWSLPSDIRLRLYDLLKPTVEPRPDLDIGSTVLVHRSALSESKLPDSVNEDTVLLRGKIFRRLSPFKDFQVDFGDHIQDVPVYGFLESTWQERHETLALARRSKVFAPVEPGSNQFVLASIAHDYSGSGQVFVKMPNQKAYAKLRRDELVWAAPRTVGAFLSGGEQQTRGRRPGNKRTKQ